MKKQHNKKIIMVVCLTIFFILLLAVVTYAADTPKGPRTVMFPSISDLFSTKNTYLGDWQNYYLDMKDSGVFKDYIMAAVNVAANVLFYIIVGITYILIILVYYSFKISFVSLLGTTIDTITQNLKTNIFDQLSGVFISLIVIFYIAKIIREQKTQVWVAIIQTIIIIAIGTQLMLYPTKTLAGIEDFSNGASQTVLSSTFQLTNNQAPDSAVEAACNNLWIMFVHTPWKMLEFGDGDTKYVNAHLDDILSMPVGSDARKKYINNLAKDGVHFAPDWALDRVCMILLYAFPMLVQVCIIALLALLTLIFEALFVIFVVFGPFIFLISLVPWWGVRTLQNYLSKLIGYGSMKIIISLLIAVMFSIDTALFDISNKTYGWYISLLLELVIGVAVYWKRNEVLGFISNIKGAHELPGSIDRQVRKGADTEKYMKYITNIRYRRGGGGNGDTTPIGSSNGSSRYGNYNQEGQSSKDVILNPNKLGPIDSGIKEKPKSNIPGDNEQYNNSFNSLLYNNTKDNLGMRELIKLAEEILENQYESSKRESEQKAAKANKEPEYSYFVKTIMNREKMNVPKFEESEKIAVARQAKRIIDAGGNPQDMFKEQPHNEEVERPEKIIMRDNSTGEETNNAIVEEIKKEKASVELNREFSGNFSVKENTYDMGAIVDTYGEDNVRYVIDAMKQIQSSQQKINKPVNYLIESLKNNQRNSQDLRKLQINNTPGTSNVEPVYFREEGQNDTSLNEIEDVKHIQNTQQPAYMNNNDSMKND